MSEIAKELNSRIDLTGLSAEQLIEIVKIDTPEEAPMARILSKKEVVDLIMRPFNKSSYAISDEAYGAILALGPLKGKQRKRI